MISIVRSFGAPVIEPPGNDARRQSTIVRVGAQAGAHRRDQLVDGLVALDAHQRRHAHRADLGDAAEVVAQHVDDHQVLGAVLGRRAQARRRPRDPRAAVAPRATVPLIGLASRPPARSSARKRSGEELEHLDAAEAQERGERARG